MKFFRKSTASKNRKQKNYNAVPRYHVDVRVTANSGTRNTSSSSYQKRKKR